MGVAVVKYCGCSEWRLYSIAVGRYCGIIQPQEDSDAKEVSRACLL